MARLPGFDPKLPTWVSDPVAAFAALDELNATATDATAQPSAAARTPGTSRRERRIGDLIS